MKPVLTFSPIMFAAAQSGRKDVTRRVCLHYTDDFEKLRLPEHITAAIEHTDTGIIYRDRRGNAHVTPFPYGPPGTILPMATTWRVAGYWGTASGNDEGYRKPCELDPAAVKEAGGIYWEDVGFVKSDGTLDTQRFSFEGRSRPARFLPASLYALAPQVQIVSTRAEALHDITEEDAQREGASPFGRHSHMHRDGFERLWDSINAKRNNGQYVWAKNPIVWRIEFKPL